MLYWIVATKPSHTSATLRLLLDLLNLGEAVGVVC